MTTTPPPSLSPLPSDMLQQVDSLTAMQLAWLSGYCWSRCQQGGAAGTLTSADPTTTALPAAAQPVQPARSVTVISASQTGNARRVAEQLLIALEKAHVNVRLVAAADFKTKALVNEDIVLLVTSTQGDGEPPEEAVPLYKFVFGKKAPKLNGLDFAVLALGDSSYPDFCQAGKDFDAQFEKLGAHRLVDRVDCDLDFQASATAWIESTVPRVVALAAPTTGTAIMPGTVAGAGTAAGADAGTGTGAASQAVEHAQRYTREQPFTASLSARQKITSRHSGKDVQHIEISLEGSGIQYRPGDSLGIWPLNAGALVDEILSLHQLQGNESVALANGTHVDIRTALTEHADITQNTPALVNQYATLSNDAVLQQLGADPATLRAYLESTPPVGVFAEHPHPLSAQTLLELFRPQTPRLYSISSSQDEVGDEVHLTVGVVRFDHHEHTYTGAASGYLGERLEVGDDVRVFVEPNPYFRLPENGETPIIMIGAGTGIAPFRAFMQQRENNGDTGPNWLIFGYQRFTDDFLYHLEWLRLRKLGLLTRADLAWSRQGPKKVYVQDKILAAGALFWQWLQEGAHVYVCGDGSRMARDVEKALISVIGEHGGLGADDADEYLNDLRENKRYQRDVY
ncbi:MAG: assimilatory sulfite reductase (NADPH) flavoprotein subunit [Lautropia sp.]|nr:assimilatory sulfite reductase (NADPH) flavoprotein subunit [Lautropia sp.]